MRTKILLGMLVMVLLLSSMVQGGRFEDLIQEAENIKKQINGEATITTSDEIEKNFETTRNELKKLAKEVYIDPLQKDDSGNTAVARFDESLLSMFAETNRILFDSKSESGMADSNMVEMAEIAQENMEAVIFAINQVDSDQVDSDSSNNEDGWHEKYKEAKSAAENAKNELDEANVKLSSLDLSPSIKWKGQIPPTIKNQEDDRGIWGETKTFLILAVSLLGLLMAAAGVKAAFSDKLIKGSVFGALGLAIVLKFALLYFFIILGLLGVAVVLIVGALRLGGGINGVMEFFRNGLRRPQVGDDSRTDEGSTDDSTTDHEADPEEDDGQQDQNVANQQEGTYLDENNQQSGGST